MTEIDELALTTRTSRLLNGNPDAHAWLTRGLAGSAA
jgi:hypothetical protein